MSTRKHKILVLIFTVFTITPLVWGKSFSEKLVENWKMSTALFMEKTMPGSSFLLFPPPPAATVSVRVNASSDDAEQNLSTGAVVINSSDLELAVDVSASQLVGMRFNGITIPSGATITNAYVEFETDAVWTTACSLTIQGQAADNPNTFVASNTNLSARPKTTASVAWSPAAWNTVDEKHQSPNLSSIIQEIVNRSGWASGNSMVIFVQGTGTREAESFDGEAAAAPLLVVEYSTGGTAGTQNPLDGNEGFQILSEGNLTFTGYAHVHGPLGIGGNLILNNNSSLAEICMDGVGSYIFPGDGTTTTGLLVKGGVTWTLGGAKVMGGKYMHIGNSTGCTQSDNGVNMATQVLPTGGSYNQAKRIEGALDQTPSPAVFQSVGFDFTSLFNNYRTVSASLESAANTVQLQTANGVDIAGNNVTSAQNVQVSTLANGVNYLDLSQTSLNNITELKLNSGAMPSASKLLVITVPLTSNFVWNNSNMPGLSGFNHGAYILWNFSGTSTYNLTINTASLIIGTIFAPNHNLFKNGQGDIDGNIVAKSIQLGNGEIHYYPFNGNVQISTPSVEICANGLDDDGDGLTDGADPDCGFFCNTGGLTLERWLSVGGTAVTDLTGNANYPNNPSVTSTLTSFDGPDDVADNYGTRVRGFISPGQTGNYLFNLTSDDDAVLYLSTDANSSNKVQIASVAGWTGTTEYTKYTTQTSSSIPLVAGQNYYVELLHKEGTGGDHFQVYWKTPSSSTWTIIPGSNLRPISCSEICNNGLDDDGDGLIDCNDPDCAGVSASCPSECLGSNMGFESGTTGWTIYNSVAASTADKHSGTQSLLFTGTNGYAVQNLTTGITGGTTYTLSFWVKGTADPGGWRGVLVKFKDAGGYEIGRTETVVSDHADWTQYTHIFTLPANTTNVDLAVACYGNNISTYFDDICLNATPGILPATTCSGCKAYSANQNWASRWWLHNGTGWVSYDFDNDVQLCDNGDGTMTLQGNAVYPYNEGGTPCGATSGWFLNATISNKLNWSQFGGNVDNHAFTDNGCPDRHTEWEFWDITGTITGTGCNSGSVFNITGNEPGYKVQVGYGANRNTCGFGLAGWVKYDDGGVQRQADIYLALGKECYTAIERCSNNIDDDGDGLADCNDPDCSSDGYAAISTGDLGDTGGWAVRLAPDGDGAEIYDMTDRAKVDLGRYLEAGDEYIITWRRRASYTNTATADMVIEESYDGITWTQNPVKPATSERVVFINTSMTANVPLRYLRFSQLTGTDDDYEMDAVTIPGCSVVEPCPNFVQNGEFDDNLNNWSLWMQSGNAAAGALDNTSQLSGTYSGLVNITTVTGTNWHIQVAQLGFSIEPGKNYRVTFEAKAAGNRNMAVSLQRSNSPYTTYWWQDLALTTTANTYSYDFQVDSTNVGNVGLLFHLGESTQNVWLDNVSFSEICDLTEICDNGIDDDGDGRIDSADPDCCPNDLTNPEFDGGTTDWFLSGQTGGNGTFSIDNTGQISGANSAKIIVTSGTGTDWHLQFGQTGKTLESGKIYNLSFDIKAAAPRNASLMLQLGASPWTTYFWENLSLTTSTLTYSFNIHSNYDVIGNVNLVFNLGESAETVWIDNVFFAEQCSPYEICDNGIDDDGDGLVDCDDPDCSITSNSGMETGNPKFAFATTLEGNPAEKLLNGSGDLPEWYPGLSGNCMYYVDDTQGSVNNPEGNYFVWLPQIDDCFIPGQTFFSLGMVDGTSYTLTFEAAAWGISLDGSCHPDGGSVTQTAGAIRIEMEDPSYNNSEIETHVVPQSPSWANLAWQKYSYTFTYDSAIHGKFVLTNGGNIGLAIDNVIFSESSCVSGTEICGNGIDDDGDGLIDSNDPDCYECTGGLLTNPDFENDFTGWWSGTGSSITTDAFAGTKAAHQSGQEGGLSQTIPATPGKYYALEVYAKKVATEDVSIGVLFFDASNNTLRAQYVSVTSSNFEQYYLATQAPANTATVQIVGWKSAGTGSATWDAFCFTEFDLPTPTCPGNSCEITIEEGTAAWLTDYTGTGSNHVGYVLGEMVLCDNEDGTYNIKGTIFNSNWGMLGSSSVCGTHDEWEVNLNLFDKQTWAEFGGSYQGELGCEDHTNWDYWEVNGILVGLGCNAGDTIFVTGPVPGYRLQVGAGAVTGTCAFGLATWFEGHNKAGDPLAMDIYVLMDSACYTPPTEICNNGIDDDGDGLIDCDDPECDAINVTLSEDCGTNGVGLTLSGGTAPYSYVWSDIPAPTAQWTFENSTNDVSGNGHHENTASSLGTPTYSIDAVEGQTSVSLNGSTYLRYSIDGAFMEVAFTEWMIATWIKPTALTGIQTIIDEGGATNGIAVRLNNNVLEFAARDAGVQVNAGTHTFPSDGAWHHVAAVFANDSLTLYLDGVAGTTAYAGYGAGGVGAHSGNGGIGYYDGGSGFGSGTGNYFTGLMDDFRYYFNQSLTASQIADLARNDGNRENLAAGTYTVTVQDSDGGCSAIESITVNFDCAEICDNGIDDDGDGLIDSADPDCISFCPTGGLTMERWLNIGAGTAVTDLTNNANYPDNPTETGTLTSFDGPDNYADNYGTRVRGYITPSLTGAYLFNITADDNCQLYLSTDADATNKILIANIADWTNQTEHTKFTTQTSSTINLVAGQNYYVELLHKEGGGGDHFQVYWKTPSSSTWTIIPGSNLRPFVCSEICGNGLDDDGDGNVDCADTDCKLINLATPVVSSCIDHPLQDVATVSVQVSWTNPPANDQIEVSIYGQTERINVGGGASSPQTVTFTVPANGETNKTVTAAWRVNSSLCSTTTTFDVPVACSGDAIVCDILYLCGEDKPYDGDPWDHGFINYLDEVNGANIVVPVLTRPDGSGMGTYDVNNPTTPVTLNLNDYGLIVVSATTEAHISNDLIAALKNFSGSVMNSNYTIINDLGMSASEGGYQFQNNLYIDNVASREIYNYNNDINPSYSKVFTRGNYTGAADAYLWTNAGEQALGVNGVFFTYESTDALPGVAAGHGIRVYLGYHMNGVYANSQNGGALPAPVESYFVPATHLTLEGKYYFDQAILDATRSCNVEICNNGIDDDGNGLIDCNDPVCGNVTVSAVAKVNPINCPILNNGQLTITATGDNLEYSIDNGATYQSSNVFTGLSAGSYIVRVRNSGSACFENFVNNPVVLAAPTCDEICNNGIDDDGDGLIDCADTDCVPSAFAGSDQSICLGSNAILSALGTGGTAPYTYNWDNGLGSGKDKTVSPIVTTTYSVTVADAYGCSDSDQLTITVTPCSEVCADGIDNDGDGLIDCDDPDCSAVGQPQPLMDSYSTCPGVSYTEQVIFNDNNLQAATFSIFSSPTKGSVSINNNGVFTYNPYSSSCGIDRFVYQVCNQPSGCCDTASVFLSIGDVVPPVLQNIPADLTVSCDEAIPETSTQVYAIDDCPGIYVSYEETSTLVNNSCETYTISRTWSATDRCGNTAYGTQTITVEDRIEPELFRVYTLPNGKKLIAGVARQVTNDWKYLNFPIDFETKPVVFSQVITKNEASAVTVRLRNVSIGGVEMRLQEEQISNGEHAYENVAWIAVEEGGFIGESNFQVELIESVTNTLKTWTYANPFTNTPAVIFSTQTYHDMDPNGVRYSNLSPTSVKFFIEEEASLDAELIHGAEDVGAMAFNAGILEDEDGTFVGESGSLLINQNTETINLTREYNKPVVILGGVDSGGDPTLIRVSNVTSNSFDVALEEWDYLNGNHAKSRVSYLVVEGSIPITSGFACDNNVIELLPNINLFVTDNCDNQVTLEYIDSSQYSSNGNLVNKTWRAIDDCGNVSSFHQVDTCNLAAVRLRTMLYGPLISNSPLSLMNDDLRVKGYVPTKEPYTGMNGFKNYVNDGGELIINNLLDVTGNNAIVDWVFVEIRDDEKRDSVIITQAALLQRDGDVISNSGEEVLFFPIEEGNFHICIRHRNHLGMMTETPEFLNTVNVPLVDFTNNDLVVRGSSSAGHLHATGLRALWSGDLNNDGKVIYQGPSNDVFHLFSFIIGHNDNYEHLANYISYGYSNMDLNMDGRTIYQGPINDRAPILYHTILAHPGNQIKLANYIVSSSLP
ncbi:MAG: carbohydrate binding domain-containing protein [Saprospiraceae bacterium]